MENKNLSKWLADLPQNHRLSLEYVLSRFFDFPGQMVVVGSSLHSKYPMGRDIDLVLVGLGIADAKKYVRRTYESFSKEFIKNMRNLRDGGAIHKLDYPLIVELRHCLDDPDISQQQEMLSGHGGSNILLGIRSSPLEYNKQFFDEHLREYKQRRSGRNRTFIDIIVDFSFKDEGIEKNVASWERAMKKEKRKWLVIKD